MKEFKRERVILSYTITSSKVNPLRTRLSAAAGSNVIVVKIMAR